MKKLSLAARRGGRINRGSDITSKGRDRRGRARAAIALAAASVLLILGAQLAPVAASEELAWITSPEKNAVVGGRVTVTVEHRCPNTISGANLHVLNTTTANSFVIKARSLNPVVFDWDSGRTSAGTTSLRAALYDCQAPKWGYTTERRTVIVGVTAIPPVTVPPTTVPTPPPVPAVPDVPTVPTVPDLPTPPTVPPPPSAPSLTAPAPLPAGTGVKATVRIWHFYFEWERLYASCTVEVVSGSGIGAVLDAAQAKGCIKSWVPYGDGNSVACIDGVCTILGDLFWPFVYDRWEYPRSLEVAGGETIDVRYTTGGVRGCSLFYGCW